MATHLKNLIHLDRTPERYKLSFSDPLRTLLVAWCRFMKFTYQPIQILNILCDMHHHNLWNFLFNRNKVDWAMEMKPEPGISDTTEDNFNESASNQSTASSHGHCIDEFKSHGHINSTHSPTCSSDGYADTCCIKTEDELTEMLQEGQVYDIAGQSEPGCLSHVRVKLEAEQSDDCSGYGGDTRRWVVDEDGELQEVLKVETTDEAAEAFARQDSINDSDPEELCGVIDAEGNDIDKPHTCFTCSVCGRPFARSSTRNIHERTHTGEKPFTCSTCGKAFTQSGSLKAHERIHTGVKPYSCTTCFRSFVASCDLRRHERIHTGTRPYACASCGKSFAYSSVLKNHERIHTGLRPFICSTCDKSFIILGDLRKHERTHSDVKPYPCATCGKSFRCTSELKKHERVHTGLKPFECSICGHSFARAKSLMVHEQIHAGIKPYPCLVCGRSFVSAGYLKKHEKNHTDLKPYSCGTCAKVFRTSSELKSHERVHVDIKPYSCSRCGKDFRYSSNLRVHERTHEDVEPFTTDATNTKQLTTDAE